MPHAAPTHPHPHPSPDHKPQHLDAADAIYDRLVRAQHYAEAHWRELTGVAAAAVVVLAFGVWMRGYRASRGVVAADALYAATAIEDDAARRAALEEVLADHPGTGAGLQAAFTGAQLAFEAKAYDDAVRIYERILKAQPYSPLAPAAAIALGTAQEAAGNTDAARAAYERAIASYPDAPALPQARLALGRLAEARDDTPAALEYYRAIVSNAPGSAWARQASGRVAALAPEPAAPDTEAAAVSLDAATP